MAGQQPYQLTARTLALSDVIPTQAADGATEVGKNTIQDLVDLVPSPLAYLSYVAKLTQSGTNAPVATVLQNELGGTVVWTRVATGQYRATLADVFTNNKTVGFMNASVPDFQCQPYPFSTSIFEVDIQDLSGASIDGALFGNCIEIRVYL